MTRHKILHDLDGSSRPDSGSLHLNSTNPTGQKNVQLNVFVNDTGTNTTRDFYVCTHSVSNVGDMEAGSLHVPYV